MPSCAVLLLSCVSAVSFGGADNSVRAEVADRFGVPVNGPLCGPFSACAAMRRLGADCQPADFVSSRYVGACEGSTGEEVIRAIEDSGYGSLPFGGVSTWDILLEGRPFIAMVRSSVSADLYSHWITVEYGPDNKLLVFDGAESPYYISEAEFMAIWNGRGIFVYPPRQAFKGWNIALLRTAMVLFAVLCVSASGRMVSLLGLPANWRAEALFLALVAGASLGACAVGMLDYGNWQRGLSVATAPFVELPAPVSLQDALAQVKLNGSILVDARFPQDFAAGTIEGSVNLPVNANLAAVSRRFSGIAKDTEIYVYCQSEACKFDETVARQLRSLGFTNVLTCKEGYYEYLKQSQEVG